MLKILRKGMQVNAPLDQTGFTGDPTKDAALAVVTAIKSGRVAAIGASGVKLANTADGTEDEFVGFIINDAAGNAWENQPALASGIVPLAAGPCVVITDQIVTTETFAKGDKLYVAGGDNKGLVTKTPETGGNQRLLGIALSAASASAPELEILVF